MQYHQPYAKIGIGADIKWCNKAHGGKRCLFCRHYAEFAEWSVAWYWHYLLNWSDNINCHSWLDYAHSKYPWSGYYGLPYVYTIEPGRYRTAGLKEHDLNKLLKVGCKASRKCKCVSVLQRGSWYCPQCWTRLNQLAENQRTNIHDIIIANRDEIKTNLLISQLAGIL